MTAYTYYRPVLYPKQEQAIFNDSRIAVIEASTKSGKTHGCLAWLAEQALVSGQPGRHYWWVAPVFAQTKIAFRRMCRALPRNSYTKNLTELSIVLKMNDATIQFKSGENPDSLYGEDVWAAVFDEATRAREEAWHALRSTLTATRGPVRIVGNVRGRRNWVYKLARSTADVHYAKITAWDAADAGIIDREEIEAARRELNDENVFKELYEAEAGDDGGNPFSLTHLEKCFLQDEPTVIGTVRAWGIDLAKSQDYTVIVGIDEFGYVAHFDRFQDTWENTKARIEQTVGYRTPVLCDATGVGDPIVESLQSAGCRVEGFIFGSISKQQLMQQLRLVIQMEEISWTEEILEDELEAFEYVYTRTGVKYSAPYGVHDDTVCSLALAVKCWRDHAFGFWPYDNTLESEEGFVSRLVKARAPRIERQGRPEMAGVMGVTF